MTGAAPDRFGGRNGEGTGGGVQADLGSTLPGEASVTREVYVSIFGGALRREIREAPVLDVAKGTLATDIKLSALAL